MNIDAQSNARFGDVVGLRDFFFVHRLVHLQVDDVITRAGGGSLPNATLDSETALDAWVRAVTPGAQMTSLQERALTDWLQLHDNLHQAEYSALKLGESPDVSQADFRNEDQFYQWMYAHQALHRLLGQAVGVS